MSHFSVFTQSALTALLLWVATRAPKIKVVVTMEVAEMKRMANILRSVATVLFIYICRNINEKIDTSLIFSDQLVIKLLIALAFFLEVVVFKVVVTHDIGLIGDVFGFLVWVHGAPTHRTDKVDVNGH